MATKKVITPSGYLPKQRTYLFDETQVVTVKSDFRDYGVPFNLLVFVEDDTAVKMELAEKIVENYLNKGSVNGYCEPINNWLEQNEYIKKSEGVMGNWNEDGKERDLNEPEEITGLCWEFECPHHNICMYARGNWKPDNGCRPASVPFWKKNTGEKP